MSKRLRGAVRAGHKGRALRPRSVQAEAEGTSTPPPAPSSPPEASPSSPRIHESLIDALQHHAELEAEARSSQAPALEASAEEDEEDSRSADTVREPSLIPPEPKPSPPEAQTPAPLDEAPLPVESAKPASLEPVSSAPTTTVEPAIKTAMELGLRDQESKEESRKETKAPASFNEEQKEEEPSEARAEETTQEPVSSAPSTKVEPALRAAKKQAAREPTSKSGKTQKKAKAEESKEPAAESKAHRGSLASLSGEFFQGEVDDSLPPLVEEHEHDDELVAELAPPLSPEQIERRARLRRIVAGVVVFAGVLSLAVLGKALLGSKPQSSTAAPLPALTQGAKPSSPLPAEAPKLPEPAKSAEVKGASVGVEEKTEEKAEIAPAADAAALKQETLSLLNRGLNKDAIVKGREAIAADPSDAEPYLYLGSALQTLGKWPDAIEVYSDCVRKASRGPVHECRAMGGHK